MEGLPPPCISLSSHRDAAAAHLAQPTPLSVGTSGRWRRRAALGSAACSGARRRRMSAPPPCRFFASGTCARGAACRFAHTLPSTPTAHPALPRLPSSPSSSAGGADAPTLSAAAHAASPAADSSPPPHRPLSSKRQTWSRGSAYRRSLPAAPTSPRSLASPASPSPSTPVLSPSRSPRGSASSYVSSAARGCDVRGGYAAAALLPWRRSDDGRAAVLLGVERRRKEGVVLTMLAGKVDAPDADALVTAVREFDEESGGFLGAAWQRETLAALGCRFGAGVGASAGGASETAALAASAADGSVAALDAALSALSLSPSRADTCPPTNTTTRAASSPQKSDAFRPGAESAVAWAPGWRGLIFCVPAAALGAAFQPGADPDVRARHAAAVAAAGARSTENMLSLEWVPVRDLLAAGRGSAAAHTQLPAPLGRVLDVTLREGPVVEHLRALERGGEGAARRPASPTLAKGRLDVALFCDADVTLRTRAFASAGAVGVRACGAEDGAAADADVGDFSSADGVRAVCVLQGEAAFVHPLCGDSRFVCSDEATTCAIIFLRAVDGSAAAGAHVDSPSCAEQFFQAAAASPLFAAGAPPVEAFLVGAYRGGDGSSELVQAITAALAARAVPIRVACVLDENVLPVDGAGGARPAHAGAVLDVLSGELRPARVKGWGADELPRRARLWTTHAGLDVVHGGGCRAEVGGGGAWALTAASIRRLLSLDDAALLAQTSTSPNAEADGYARTVRDTLAYIGERMEAEAAAEAAGRSAVGLIE